MAGNGCDTCKFKRGESVDGDGNRIVDCAANRWQMYSPLADECKHWVGDAATSGRERGKEPR